jgi:hypothetical protein
MMTGTRVGFQQPEMQGPAMKSQYGCFACIADTVMGTRRRRRSAAALGMLMVVIIIVSNDLDL